MIYLDYASTFPTYKSIIEKIPEILNQYDFNPSARYGVALKTKDFLYNLRNELALFFNVSPFQLIFTSSATESINTVLRGLNIKHKNKILTSKFEHKAVLETLKSLKSVNTCLLKTHKGYVEYEDFIDTICEETKLVSIIHINNETGAYSDIKSIAKKIKKKYPYVLIMCDMAQSFGKIDLSLENIDFAVMSSHKIGGLKGSGLLFVRNPEMLNPLITGGGQEFKLRSGTENVLSIWSMVEALKITQKQYKENVNYIKILNEELTEFCKSNNFKINSPENSVDWIFNFSTMRIFSEIMINYLSSKGIYISSASACSGKSRSHVLKNMKFGDNVINTAIRVSLSFQTEKQDVYTLCNEIENAIKILI